MSHGRLASRLSCKARKALTLIIICKLFNDKLFHTFLAYTVVGTIDFYHFILLSLTWALPGGHQVSTKQNQLASFSPTLFI